MASIKSLEANLKELQDAIQNADEEDIPQFKELIEETKAEIAKAKSLESQKDSLKVKAEKKIAKIEKSVASPKTPAKVKGDVVKRIATAKKQIKEAEKEDVRERKTRVAKKSVASVKKVATAKRGRPKKAAPKKEVVKRKSKAVVKYEKAIVNLDKLINRTEALKSKYKGQGVDLEKDATRKAKPFGWRLRGQGVYRKPTRAEIKDGSAYYEARPSKADVSRSKYPKLEDGGMMARGGFTKNKKGEYRKQTKSEIKNDIKAGAAKKPGWKTSDVTGNRYFEDRPNRTDKSRKLKYDDGGMMSKDAMMNDGGMMARGGFTKNRKGEYRKQTKSEIANDIKAGAAKKPGWKTSDVTGNRYFEDRPNRTDKSRKLKY